MHLKQTSIGPLVRENAKVVNEAAEAERAELIRPPLPADVTINKDAGRGNRLIVTLRLESGQELPLIVDTGSQATILDNSLEPQLGARLGTATVAHFGTKQKAGVYPAPKLFLDGTPLMPGIRS